MLTPEYAPAPPSAWRWGEAEIGKYEASQLISRCWPSPVKPRTRPKEHSGNSILPSTHVRHNTLKCGYRYAHVYNSRSSLLFSSCAISSSASAALCTCTAIMTATAAIDAKSRVAHTPTSSTSVTVSPPSEPLPLQRHIASDAGSWRMVYQPQSSSYRPLSSAPPARPL